MEICTAYKEDFSELLSFCFWSFTLPSVIRLRLIWKLFA